MARLFWNRSAKEPGQRDPLVAGPMIWSCDESGIAPELWHRRELSKNYVARTLKNPYCNALVTPYLATRDLPFRHSQKQMFLETAPLMNASFCLFLGTVRLQRPYFHARLALQLHNVDGESDIVSMGLQKNTEFDHFLG